MKRVQHERAVNVANWLAIKKVNSKALLLETDVTLASVI